MTQDAEPTCHGYIPSEEWEALSDVEKEALIPQAELDDEEQ